VPSRRTKAALAALLAFLTCPLGISAAIGDIAADRVVGQPNATSDLPNAGGINSSSLGYPQAATFDAAGNLFVLDAGNSRVLGYRLPMTTDRVADIVLGQPDFNSGTPNNGGVSATSLYRPFGVTIDPTGSLAIVDYKNHRVVLLETPTPIVTSIAVKVSPTTRKVKLVVRGFGMQSGSAVIEVNGTRLSTTKYKDLAADGSARRVVAIDPSIDTLVPRGVPVSVTIFNPTTGGRSAPIAFTR
jgi:hypothetical protein